MTDENEVEIGKSRRPNKDTKQKKDQYIGPDGVGRLPAAERKLNEVFAITFRDQCGKDALDYLKSITTNRVLPPGLPPESYVYQEGARWLMGVISTRIKDGEDKKP